MVHTIDLCAPRTQGEILRRRPSLRPGSSSHPERYDCPEQRPIQVPKVGKIVAIPALQPVSFAHLPDQVTDLARPRGRPARERHCQWSRKTPRCHWTTIADFDH
jgi:hypothetical protein